MPTEVATIKDMVLAPEYRHMPLSTLAVYAQRIGKWSLHSGFAANSSGLCCYPVLCALVPALKL
jgi:hypothetical protein